jgi:hypothetical protein
MITGNPKSLGQANDPGGRPFGLPGRFGRLGGCSNSRAKLLASGGFTSVTEVNPLLLFVPCLPASRQPTASYAPSGNLVFYYGDVGYWSGPVTTRLELSHRP